MKRLVWNEEWVVASTEQANYLFPEYYSYINALRLTDKQDLLLPTTTFKYDTGNGVVEQPIVQLMEEKPADDEALRRFGYKLRSEWCVEPEEWCDDGEVGFWEQGCDHKTFMRKTGFKTLHGWDVFFLLTKSYNKSTGDVFAYDLHLSGWNGKSNFRWNMFFIDPEEFHTNPAKFEQPMLDKYKEFMGQ